MWGVNKIVSRLSINKPILWRDARFIYISMRIVDIFFCSLFLFRLYNANCELTLYRWTQFFHYMIPFLYALYTRKRNNATLSVQNKHASKQINSSWNLISTEKNSKWSDTISTSKTNKKGERNVYNLALECRKMYSVHYALSNW